jgi:hypothetical protein
MDGCQCPLVTDQVAVANALARYGRRSRAVTFALNMIRQTRAGEQTERPDLSSRG